MSDVLDSVAGSSGVVNDPAKLSNGMRIVARELRANSSDIDRLCRDLPSAEADYKRALLSKKSELWFEYGKSWPQQVHTDQADLECVDLWDAYNVLVLELKAAQAKQKALMAQLEVMRTQSADLRKYVN